MKKNNTSLPLLWGAAGLSLLIGLLLSVRALNGIGRTTEIWQKKSADLQEMQALRTVALEQRNLLKGYAKYPTAPVPLEELARTAVPGLNLMIRSKETHPALQGWTARKVSLGLVDITGDDLGRFLEAISSATPPWALLEGSLSASPASGRLAKVELVIETVERN